jgi:chromosome segregation ATPase
MTKIEDSEAQRASLLQDLDQRRRERDQLSSRRDALTMQLDGCDEETRLAIEGQIGALTQAMHRVDGKSAELQVLLNEVDGTLRYQRNLAQNARAAIKGAEETLRGGRHDAMIRSAEFNLAMVRNEKDAFERDLLGAYTRLAELEGEKAARGMAAKFGRELNLP